MKLEIEKRIDVLKRFISRHNREVEHLEYLKSTGKLSKEGYSNLAEYKTRFSCYENEIVFLKEILNTYSNS